MLDFGDVAFWGNGPNDEPWWIGIEYKQIEDVVGCIKSGRFTGTQLPGMMKYFDQSFLLVEGIGKPDPHSGQLVRYRGKQIYGAGLRYDAYDNFLTSVAVFSALAGRPCIVKQVGTEFDSICAIRDIYKLFQKPWDAHTSMSRPDSTKMVVASYELEIVRTNPELDDKKTPNPNYPKYYLRKALMQILGISWELAGHLADHFGTMEAALGASQRDWEALDRIGKGLAKRAYFTLHGYEDPNYSKRKRKKGESDVQLTSDTGTVMVTDS